MQKWLSIMMVHHFLMSKYIKPNVLEKMKTPHHEPRVNITHHGEKNGFNLWDFSVTDYITLRGQNSWYHSSPSEGNQDVFTSLLWNIASLFRSTHVILIKVWFIAWIEITISKYCNKYNTVKDLNTVCDLLVWELTEQILFYNRFMRHPKRLEAGLC